MSWIEKLPQAKAKLAERDAEETTTGTCLGASNMSWMEKLRRAKAEGAERDADPLRQKVEAIVRGMDAISTVALLDLLGLPKTTGNGRRVASTMRTLGFIPIKSRRLMPGGYRDTVTRGWARPLRSSSNSVLHIPNATKAVEYKGGINEHP